MDEVEIDFSGAVDFDPIPDGNYTARVLKCEAGLSKSGNPKLAWTFGLTEDGFVGRQLIRHTPTTGKGSGLAKQAMKALGFDTQGDRVRFKPSAAVGKDCILVVGKQKDNPEYNEIKRVNPAAASGIGNL